ncbi:site-specific DNA-methyltransferase [Patescibacteria group bacterium]|nr:site-specific DNA-methyltransferase [Patescibacteria group bacterium]
MNNKLEIEKLNKEVERLKKELKKKKKYGLVWEEKPEELVEMCKEKLPVLKEVKNKEIITDKDKPVNLLIEGDNYHALSVLNYTHNKKIDVIYIDPPYNTGNKDFIFNDHYVDKEDSYRHSKWLSFMEKRLRLAKNLLKDTGVIFISIDDNEIAPLRLLTDQIFNDGNIDIMVWRKSGDGRDGKMKNTTTFRKDHEYVIVGFKNKRILNKILEKPNFQNVYDNIDNDLRGPYKAGSISRREDASNPKHKNFYTVKSPSGKKFTRQFDIPQEEFELLNKDGRIYWGKNNNSVPAIKIFINEQREITPYSVLLTKGTTTGGKEELRELFNLKDTDEDIFSNPKPTLLIKTLIQLGSKKESIIVDFMAGSGTTGHAVMKLNKEDGGNRKFILCTDNQDNNGSGLKIAEDICYPRIKKVIEGYKNLKGEKVEGLGGNLKYFKTNFVEYDEPTDKNKIKLTKQATDMLCVKEETFELVRDGEDFKIFKNHDHYTGIIFDQVAISAFKKAIKDIKDKFSVYIFSLGDETFGDEFEDIKQKVQLSPIPEAILRVYRRIFK